MLNLQMQIKQTNSNHSHQMYDNSYELPSIEFFPIAPSASRQATINNFTCQVKKQFSKSNHFCRTNKAKTTRIQVPENINFLDQKELIFSNIKQLKSHALKLQDDNIAKLGKQNTPLQIQNLNSRLATTPSEYVFNKSTAKQYKKTNRRKIIKGRPQKYILEKKQKQPKNVLVESKNLENMNNIPSINATRDVFNPNSLLRFISTINYKENCDNLCENLLRQRRQTERSQNSSFRQPFPLRRYSLMAFGNNDNRNTILQNKNSQDIIVSRQILRKKQNSCASNRRYLSANRAY